MTSVNVHSEYRIYEWEYRCEINKNLIKTEAAVMMGVFSVCPVGKEASGLVASRRRTLKLVEWKRDSDTHCPCVLESTYCV